MASQSAKFEMQDARLGSLLLGVVMCASLAQAVQVWVPDSMTGNVGDTVRVPLLVSGHVGQGIIAADITLSFGEAVLTATDSFRLGNAAPGWMVFVNPMPCSLLIAMASASPLVAGDTLLIVKMLVDSVDTTTIPFSRCRLNEGQVPCTTQAGKFYGYAVGLQQGRGEPAIPSRLGVFPNPARASVSLEDTDPVDLVSASGQKVAVLKPGGNDVSRLPRGVYFVRLRSGEATVERKVVLLR
jgi:hypothetical protein